LSGLGLLPVHFHPRRSLEAPKKIPISPQLGSRALPRASRHVPESSKVFKRLPKGSKKVLEISQKVSRKLPESYQGSQKALTSSHNLPKAPFMLPEATGKLPGSPKKGPGSGFGAGPCKTNIF
jgi:hypothetical protein